MRRYAYILALAVSGLFAALSCDRRELDPVDPDEGKVPLVLVLEDGGSPMKVSTRSDEGDKSAVADTSFFRVETEDWPVEVETKTRVIEVSTNSLKNGNVVWGAIVGTSPVSLWNPVSVTADGDAMVATGHYVGSNGGTSNTYYVSNVTNASRMTLTSSGATLSSINNSPASGIDIVAGKTTSSAAIVNVQLEHAYARTGNVVLNAPAGVTLSNVSWYIASSGSNTGYAGTYDIDSGSWSGVTALTSRSLTASSDYYLTPGVYQLTLSYTMTLPNNSTKYISGKTGSVTLEKGKVNNIVATAPDYTEQKLYVAWVSNAGVSGTYQEVPARGDIYVGTNGATLQARLYTIRNGVMDSYTVVPNAQVTWSIPYDAAYLSINSSTGELTGIQVGSNCWVYASATVDGVSYDANRSDQRGIVNVVTNPVSYRIYLTPNPGTLEVGSYGTYKVWRQEMRNGADYGSPVQISNSDVTWQTSNGSVATIAGSGTNIGRATGVSTGSVTITVTLKSSAQYYSLYTTAGKTATASLTVISSGGWSDGWDNPGTEIEMGD